MDMRSSVLSAFTSMNEPLTFVNKFQQAEFSRLGISRRDPMFVTMLVMLEIETFPPLAILAEHSNEIDVAKMLEKCYLKSGMTAEEVVAVWHERGRSAWQRSF